MERSPESRQPLGHGAEAAAGPAAGPALPRGGAEGSELGAGRSPGAEPPAEPGGARDGQGAAAGPGSRPRARSPGAPAPDAARGGSRPGASESAPGGRRKVTAASEEAEAGGGSGGDGSPGSGGGPSPPGESPSLESLESFSNLHSCPSSSEVCSEEGPEPRGPEEEEEEEESAAGPAAPLGKEEALAASKERFPGQSVYHIKWIQWKQENTPIITQNENGPCPLLAILNVLFLAWKVKLPPMMEIITAEQLMEYLGDYILDAKPKEISEIQRLNYEQNMSDAMAILHKLQTGLDVNVKFTGVRTFEYTPECIVFDLLDIPLYHGWLVDPQITDIVKAVGNCSYNQLVEKIISCKQSDNSELVSEGGGAMGHQQLYWSHPRKFGQGSRSCCVCSNRHGLIRKYSLNMCRQCFRQYAKDISFIKLD
ncbi:ubiquitin carboxyl-terminal hydrolase MINDY-2 isoform X5 [Macrotis lagotis]|uniref:ubiquitin carboxyl-terminal hydrolase MINDY-2 isoform X5 n=2 Tax=Macrotis lagotis TaxID=92651 RepID=UPI003D680397